MNDYPKMLYGKDGATRVVNSAEDEKGAGSGWSAKPPQDFGKPKDSSIAAVPTQTSPDPFAEAVANAVIAKLVNAGILKPEAASAVTMRTITPTSVTSAPAGIPSDAPKPKS